ncbi:helix-turn-helix transcriptional regulator [Rurimicrobium arvi]|uniref:Helix-turn-helix domain-containing protein n=1 Tax=Rurimicrobium arvi TaxID=2049916 RepID=A0ABP8MYK0_9BACT
MKQIPVNNLPKGDEELKVLPLGHFTPYDFQRPHRHSYFEFFLFEKGGGSHFIDFAEHPIRDYSVHVVFPQQIHLVKRREQSTGSIVLCSRNYMNLIGTFFFPQLLRNNYHAPCLQFDKKDFAGMMDIIVQLYEELQQHSVLSYNLAQNYTSIFLTRCIRHTADQLQDEGGMQGYSQHDWEVYKKFSELLEGCFMEKPNVAYYAKELAMTPKVLNNCLDRVVGKTAIELLQERTWVEAKRLLLHTGDAVKEIAYKLNFKDSSYFTRFFTRQEGQTPKEFRSYWEEKYHS